MKKIILCILGVILLTVIIIVFAPRILTSKAEEETNKTEVSVAGTPEENVKKYEIRAGDTFTGVLTSLGVSYDDALAIIDSAKETFDVRNIQPGKTITLIFAKEALAAIEYPITGENMLMVKKENDQFLASKEPIPYEIRNERAESGISDSLFLAGEKIGLEDKTIMELSEIFSSDIDFATDIQAGDSFSLVYEKRTLGGEDAGSGKILAAKFTSGGATFTGFRYKDKFYDAEGNSLSREFLKSPLNYTRISSGFTYNRKHPITKKVGTHRAIDYAAPSGTVVLATSDGKITTAGSKGLLGITVEIKYENYLTQYAHLSKIAKSIKNGVTVSQGDVIGYVGSTGRSTGPHLQYAMFKDGTPINPQGADLPTGKPLPPEERAGFEETMKILLPELD